MHGRPTYGPSTDAYQITHHADLRWVQRAQEFECRLCEAWRRADAVRLRYADFERVGHDPETGTLICVENNEVVTVLIAAYEQYEHITPEVEECETASNEIKSTNKYTEAAAAARGDD